MAKLTPMMQQYRETKEKHHDCLLFFRVGDFFEVFFEDAELVARELNIALTSRDGHIAMAGVPHHALEAYLGRLVRKGYKIAICDQAEDPQLAKGLVRREVVRIITPGTIIEDNFLEPTKNNWLLAICRGEGHWGVAFTDISTGEFFCSQFRGGKELLTALVASLNPGEVLICQDLGELECLDKISRVPVPDDLPRHDLVLHHPLAGQAVAMIQGYLAENYKGQKDLRGLAWYDTEKYMYLDGTTRRNLELIASLAQEGNGPTLLKALDNTKTAMGGRLLRQLITNPLTDPTGIIERLDGVDQLLTNFSVRKRCQQQLKDFYDLERIMTKVNFGTANARDLLALAKTLEGIPALKAALASLELCPALRRIYGDLGNYQALTSLITQGIQPNPPAAVREGSLIRPGYSSELDEIRVLTNEGVSWLKKYEADLRGETGIKTLKLGHNKVFGYYIEVTRANSVGVPARFNRKQTLVNAERFVTQELSAWEEKILSANERRNTLEYQLFCQIREKACQSSGEILATARAVASLDCFLSLAEAAEVNNYCRPEVDRGEVVEINGGRHPVVELYRDESFVPNDCLLTNRERQIMVITGPNMAGKSTYMRQVALIVLLAQMGSFVPAQTARIGIIDGIFTRIGASDDLASGRSTFMVEMTELAGILKRASANSLILLDEIGRGTGTDDGISIARATLDYIHEHPLVRAKTLFATHYHQLNAMAEHLPRLVNCSVQVVENHGRITFLHKIAEGGSDRSYGIHVARLAGLPQELVKAAEGYLTQTDTSDSCLLVAEAAAALNFVIPPDVRRLLSALRELDPEDISPRQAWEILAQLHREALAMGDS
jgi:DNA mismatch repair protein MutS